jgi:hypothetical protein
VVTDITFTYHEDMVKHVRDLTLRGVELRDIMVVTIQRPNGAGYYHPGYVVFWKEPQS